MGQGSSEKLSFRTLTKEQWQGMAALSFTYVSMMCCGVLIDPFFPPEVILALYCKFENRQHATMGSTSET